MNKKIKIVILFGGKSVEHEVSIRSAKSIFDAADKNKYEIYLIGIDKSGYWRFFEDSKVLNQKNIEPIPKNHNGFLDPDCGKILMDSDVIFPILHGTYGEDGTVPGFLKLINKPFVGAGVLGSALGMDKAIQKQILKEAGVKVADFLIFKDSHIQNIKFSEISKKLGLPFFIKPANSGSSVGISKVQDDNEFKKALKDAFQYDNKILIEKAITAREIECSVLGNDNPIASIPGEIIPKHDFYSYKAKYLDKNGAELEIPAKLDKETIKKIQEISIKVFKLLECSGMARVDFFLTQNASTSPNSPVGEEGGLHILVNEINTIPGFTSISMYPKLLEASGIKYPDLIDRLIKLAIEKFEKDKKIKTTRI